MGTGEVRNIGLVVPSAGLEFGILYGQVGYRLDLSGQEGQGR